MGSRVSRGRRVSPAVAIEVSAAANAAAPVPALKDGCRSRIEPFRPTAVFAAERMEER